MQPADPGIAVSLGPAFLGVYAHAGFLVGLEETGIVPGQIFGASAGALAAGFFASGLRGESLKKIALSRQLKSSFWDPGCLYRWFPMLAFGRPSGLLHGNRVVEFLRESLPVDRIENCPETKLGIAVTNLRDQAAPILTEGPLAESIMASCAVPGLFSEQMISGQKFFDGGILHDAPLPLLLLEEQVHTVLVHSVNYPPKKKSFGLRKIIKSSHALVSHELTKLRTAELETRGIKVVFTNTIHSHPGIFQSSNRKESYFEEGKKTGLSIR